MSELVEWVKNYSMVFLLLTVLGSVAAKQEYRKYIQIFIEIILVIALLDPVLGAAGKSGELFEKMSFESFWQGLESVKKDSGKMDFLNDDYYITYYERAIEEDVGLMAGNLGYTVIDVSVTLDEEYLVDHMEVKVAKESVKPVIIGTVEQEPERAEIQMLREKISAYYQIPQEQITIMD